VVAAALDAAAEEMSATVTRTARSPIFNEAHDFTTGIFDFRGARQARLVAQAPGCTLHLYAIVGAAQAVLDYFRHDLHAGDVVLLNDPYYGGTHGPDWTILLPVFVGSRPLLFPAVRAHMGDNGGPVAGGYNPLAREIWQEGIRIPPIKIEERGERRRDVFDWLIANNRLAGWLEGDLAAMIAACRVAERRIVDLVEQYGLQGVLDAVDATIAYTERRVREEIASWPDGVYVGETWADHDFAGHHDIRVRATVTIEGSNLVVDFTGSAPQAEGFVNSPLVNTRSFVFVAVSTCCPSDIPINEGFMRPVRVEAPPGTVVNPLPPAPCGHATAVVGAEITEAVLKALEQAVPHRVGVNAHKLPLAYTHGIDPYRGTPYVNLNFFGYTGGAGAAYGVDGWGLYPPIMTGVILPSIEMNELQSPCRVLEHEIRPDFTGAGRWRGAPGLVTRIQYLDHESRTNVMVTGHRHTVRGFAGGKDGPPSRVVMNHGTPDAREVTEVAFDVALPPGGVIYFERGGGGGWGDPFERDPQRVLEDVLDGYVSIEGARRDYGVAIDPATMTVDEAATAALRRRQD